MKTLIAVAAFMVLAFGMPIVISPSTAAETIQPRVDYVPSDSHPPVPDGLKMTCLTNGISLQTATLCPVVRDRGMTTWAYSFIDNRVSMALVSYDSQSNVVGNITEDGARYVWRIRSNAADQTLTFDGQANRTVSASWSEIFGESRQTVRGTKYRKSAHAIVNVEAPAINCIFSTKCTIMVSDSIGTFTPPGDSGEARLQSRTFSGQPGTAADGALAFEYRVNLTDVQNAGSEPNCVTRIAFDFGKPQPLPYNGVAAGLFDVFVITRGGLGSVGIATETRKGRTITLEFSQPVCPGATSYFFGLTSNSTTPVASTATLYYSLGGSEAVAVRTPQ